jgi:hypothetical protein
MLLSKPAYGQKYPDIHDLAEYIYPFTINQVWELTVVLDYYEAIGIYSRIGLLRSYRNLQSYWTSAKLWKLIVVLDYYDATETYGLLS